MKIACKYCGSLIDTDKETCPNCGASDWLKSSTETESTATESYSPQFLSMLSRMAAHDMIRDTVVYLSGMYAERYMIIPEHIYIDSEFDGTKEWIENWMQELMMTKVPQFHSLSELQSTEGMVALTSRTMLEMTAIYNVIAPDLMHNIYMELTNYGEVPNEIYVGNVIHWNNATCPTEMWIDKHNRQMCDVIERVIEKYQEETGIGGACSVEPIDQLIRPRTNSWDQPLKKYSWDDITTYAGMRSIDFLSKYTTQFVKDEVYDYSVKAELEGKCDYVKHDRSGYWLQLPNGVQFTNIMETNYTTYTRGKVIIAENSSLRCVNDHSDSLTFIASFVVKPSPFGGLGKLFQAAMGNKK